MSKTDWAKKGWPTENLKNLDSSLKLRSVLAAPDHAWIGPSVIEVATEAYEDVVREALALNKSCEDTVGQWMSAAHEDPLVCAEMKEDVRKWFEALERFDQFIKERGIKDETI